MAERRTTGCASIPRQRTRSARRRLAIGLLTGVLLAGTSSTATAAPPSNPSDEQLAGARTAKDAAAAEVGRIAALVAKAEAELQRLSHRAEAAGTAYMRAEEALAQAQEAAEGTAAQLRAAGRSVDAAVGRIAVYSRDRYMDGATLTTTAALFDAEGPGDLISRAALLDWVGDNQVDVLDQLEVAKVRQANADSAARAALDEMAAAEAAAEAAKAEADQQVSAQQGAYEAVRTQKAQYDDQLREAQVKLLRLQGARDAYREWEQQRAAAQQRVAAEAARKQRAAEQAAGGGGNAVSGSGSGYVKPFSGIVTSCYGARWGATHYGLDVASPIGTSLYAPTSGVIVRAGPATGFGLAVYMRGDDGAVFVYGHINDYFVSAGQRVGKGQRIAEVGNTGFSTGPHVHFEVHPGGDLYSGSVDPVPWLNARGVYVGGCGG